MKKQVKPITVWCPVHYRGGGEEGEISFLLSASTRENARDRYLSQFGIYVLARIESEYGKTWDVRKFTLTPA